MGYYTEYSLGIHLDINCALLGDSRKKEIVEYLLSVGDDLCIDVFKDNIKAHPNDNRWDADNTMKWYHHDVDMADLSLKFPDVVFELHGKGEEDDDLWITYYLNGQMQKCIAEIKVTYASFHASKLESVEREEP